jgi:hypothetical protein
VGQRGELDDYGIRPESGDRDEDSLKVFINYRREDAAGIALALYDRLAQRFGAESVFLDVRNLQPGTNWLEEIRSHGASCRVFVSLIGRHWLGSLRSRQQSILTDPVVDEARREIEMALSRGSEVEVIPVLIDDAAIPPPDSLPRSIRGLATRQAERLRYTHFDQDVERLIGILEDRRQRPQPAPERPAQTTAAPEPPAQQSAAPQPFAAPPSHVHIAPPDEHHYLEVMSYMAQEGTVVPVLGPNAGKLSADLSGQLKPTPDPLDLAEAAQYVYVVSGRPDLYRSLRQMLSAEREPSLTHRFLARFPGNLDKLHLPKRYQLIVTTNYDTELERAFEAENEPYDLAVYMSSGPDAGRFVHFPYHSDPEPIRVPNDYGAFPIDVETYELERTVIVKIHGAVDGSAGGYRWRENYVITEDHYIDYLSTSPVESLVPTQILTKLRDSHCLFLGYTIRDWNLRVFLKRIWNGEPLGAKSWAIQRTPDVLDRESWSQSRVDLFAAPLDDYVSKLERYMMAHSDVRP